MKNNNYGVQMMLQPYRLSPKNIINIKKGIKIKFLQE